MFTSRKQLKWCIVTHRRLVRILITPRLQEVLWMCKGRDKGMWTALTFSAWYNDQWRPWIHWQALQICKKIWHSNRTLKIIEYPNAGFAIMKGLQKTQEYTWILTLQTFCYWPEYLCNILEFFLETLKLIESLFGDIQLSCSTTSHFWSFTVVFPLLLYTKLYCTDFWSQRCVEKLSKLITHNWTGVI